MKLKLEFGKEYSLCSGILLIWLAVLVFVFMNLESSNGFLTVCILISDDPRILTES